MKCIFLPFRNINNILNIIPFCLVISLSLSSCENKKDNKDINDITTATDDFASTYFNYRLKEASKYCTDESVTWLKFVASNISQDDINLLRQQDEGAYHEVTDVEITNDTSANVECKVYNFMKLDTLGQNGTITKQALYKINLVKRGGKWLIKMGGPLRSEMRSHD